MTETTWQHLMTFWRFVEEILNALLFLTIGLEIAANRPGREVIAMAIMIPTVLVIRWLKRLPGSATAQPRIFRADTALY